MLCLKFGLKMTLSIANWNFALVRSYWYYCLCITIDYFMYIKVTTLNHFLNANTTDIIFVSMKSRIPDIQNLIKTVEYLFALLL